MEPFLCFSHSCDANRSIRFLSYNGLTENLITGSTSGRLSIWNLLSRKIIREFSIPGGLAIQSIHFTNPSASSFDLIAQTSSGNILLYDAFTKTCLAQTRSSACSFASATQIKVEDETVEAHTRAPLIITPFGSVGEIAAFDIKRSEISHNASIDNNSCCSPTILFPPFLPPENTTSNGCGMIQAISQVKKLSDSSILVAYESGHLALWDLRFPCTPVCFTTAARSPSDVIQSMCVCRNRIWIGCTSGSIEVATVKSDASIHLAGTIWDIPEESKCGHNSIETIEHKHAVGALASRFDNALIAAGRWDYSIDFYEVKSSQIKSKSKFHAAPVNCLDFDPISGILASSGADRCVAFWNYGSSNFDLNQLATNN